MTTALIAAGATSTGGLVALVVGKLRAVSWAAQAEPGKLMGEHAASRREER